MRRARKMDRILAETYPDARAELDFTNAFECLVVTVVSAQTTDRRVNAASPALFAAYPTPEAMAAASREHLEQLLGPLGFFRQKTDSLLKLSQALVENFDGQVPGRLDDLVTLPGVGRKTANVVLGNAFGLPGITVDTHFGRLARRFGWTEETDPVKVEHAVGALFPKRDWTMLSHHLIWHGRRRCHAKKPACGACPIAKLCPSFGAGPTDPVKAEHAVGALFPKRDWTMLSHHLIWHGRRCCHAQKPACGACPVADLCPSFGEGEIDAVKAAKLVKTPTQVAAAP